MSAGAIGVLAPSSARMPSHAARAGLRLVGPDERVGPDELVCAPTHSVTRLTRRGRLVITLMAAAAVVVLAMLSVTFAEAAAPEIDHVSTVLAGQTLSEVAATQLAGLPIPDAVARIQIVNRLSSLQVHAGQTLLIPAIP